MLSEIPMKSTPLNHHKVPQVYLKGFDSGRGVIVYDVSKRPDIADLVRQVDNPWIETSVKKLASEVDYYTRETANGPDYSFEEMLSRLENHYKPTMKAVRSGAPLSGEELGMLALLAAVQDARVNRMSLVKPMTEVREHAKLLYHHHRPEMSEEEIASETDVVVRRDLIDTDVPSPKNIALAAVPEMMTFSFNVFRYMFKCVVRSDAHDFVTSDSPVVWLDPAQFPQPYWTFFRLSGYMEVTFPLSRRYCLVMAWHPMPARFDADEAMVGTINARTATYARQHVFVANTGDIKDRHLNGRDFTNMQDWMGMPLTAALIDESTKLSETDAASYQLCLQKLAVTWEEARKENLRLAPRFTGRAEFYIKMQSAAMDEE
jgi:hypothetical protein